VSVGSKQVFVSVGSKQVFVSVGSKQSVGVGWVYVGCGCGQGRGLPPVGTEAEILESQHRSMRAA
jgi:hypothetical protein